MFPHVIRSDIPWGNIYRFEYRLYYKLESGLNCFFLYVQNLEIARQNMKPIERSYSANIATFLYV